ncbi:MAG: 3'(2'),5'-bisphosphate nucleotidase CysQ [Desulfosarcinaceae bacterium]|nr:3'(2'),5'-bisphosphate nucleotidase CysQ [Desulfosarcinaceae bacterium]
MTSIHQLLPPVIVAAVAAGKAILEVYGTDFDVDIKADKSPLTEADRRSHEIIMKALAETELPVLSEEGREIPYAERSAWDPFFLVDPLDGTKEFIKRNGEFTVNIALIAGRAPVMGVIYVPVKDWLYFAGEGFGAFKLEGAAAQVPADTAQGSLDLTALSEKGQALPISAAMARPFTIVGSRSHANPELEAEIDKQRAQHGEVAFISAGSSLKLCLVAEGAADLYPRTGPTMEWDTGAGQAIALFAGAEVVEFESGKPLAYNKENLLNPWFVVRRGTT